MKVEHASHTATGGRESNQDVLGATVRGDVYCFVLADGCGGHRGGGLAAAAAVSAFIDAFECDASAESSAVFNYMRAAHDAVRRRQAETGVTTMRATLVGLVVDGVRATAAHVGDSRLYRMRGGAVVAQTRDHSVAQLLAPGGEISADALRKHPDRNTLLRTLGQATPPDPTIASISGSDLDGVVHFLLCSDGWWSSLDDDVLAATTVPAARPNTWIARQLEWLAGGAVPNDNYSCVAVCRDSS